MTKEAQAKLYEQNHPRDCRTAPLLLCSTAVNKFQGMGSRLFFLGRCLAEGLNSGRVVVLSRELRSTFDMLSPFRQWSNCTVEDTVWNNKNGRIRNYYPMNSNDLRKTNEMPAVGALYPKEFKERGYWWWKAQEITYALRPTVETSNSFKEKQIENGWYEEVVTVFQIRRTDKTDGCQKTYGNFLV